MDFSPVTDENTPEFLMGTGPDHPVNVVHREWRNLKDRSDESVHSFDEKHANLLFEYVLLHMQFIPYCKDIYSNEKSTCTCLPSMVLELSDEELKDVANALLCFGKQTKEQQQIRVMDWIAHDLALETGLMGVPRLIKQKRCVLPGTYNEMICKHRLAHLAGYGKWKWTACMKLVKEKKTPLHGLNGKRSNNNNLHQGYTGVLNMFFTQIVTMAVPRATRIVRTHVEQQQSDRQSDNGQDATVRVELRDQETELMELPSSMTKRGLYARFLKDHIGIVQVLDARSRVIAVRPDTSDDHVPDCFPSWRSFNRHWETFYPKLVIARPREDVCEDCWKYANAFRFKKRDGEAQQASRRSNDSDDDDERKNNEAVVEAASLHVEQAKIQREYFNKKVEEAKASRFAPRSERTVTWVLDYAQNMSLPQFGSEQPGQTYYLCPMNIYVFGIVDTCDDTLHAKVYGEDVAGKGGNCVASMIMEHVQSQLVPTPGEANVEPIKELNLVMDNCGGQNKNRHVLRLLTVLVKRQIVKRVNAIFLVKGHTKNPCDRMFNLLKKDTREDNIYTPAMLFEALNRQDGVTAKLFDSFFDWDDWETRYMRKSIPAIKSFHLFTVDAEHKDGFYMKRAAHFGADESIIPIVLAAKREDLSWVATSPDPLERVGLTDIKHVELHDKWRPLVPQQYWNDFLYFREEPSVGKRARVQQEKNRSKKARTDRQRTDHSVTTTQQPDESTQPKST